MGEQILADGIASRPFSRPLTKKKKKRNGDENPSTSMHISE